ncbi:hypothetical protein SELMODRAFT_430656 [Selaginella moellendorffii]|uniref:PARP-type domain-containing protein n=1 Tax=Selaginella moellendorffii TaxID=88036 RepID=D8TA31_SELML|nr:hypothetical protein SELMODRAFT_430656 [Selaginella moellendorffii]
MVLKRAEEQAQIIESLQGTMVMDEMHSLTSARVECARDEADATFAKEKLVMMMQESEGCHASIASSNLPRVIGIVSKGTGIDMIKWHHSKCVLEIQAPVVGVLKAKGFAALKASDQTIMKDMLQGELWHVKLSGFEPSQLPTCYKTHRMYLCPLGVILLVNNVAAFDFDSCLVNTDVKRVGANTWSLLYTSITQKLQACHKEGYKLVVMSQLESVKQGSLRLATSLASALRMPGQLELG